MVLIQVRILIFLKAAIYENQTSLFIFFCVTGLSSFQHILPACASTDGRAECTAEGDTELLIFLPPSQVQGPSCVITPDSMYQITKCFT